MISLRNNFSWPLWYNNALRNRKRNKERKDPIWFGVYRMCVYQPGNQIYNSSLKGIIYSHALHEVNSCHLWRLGAGNKEVLHFPLLYPTGFLESLCFQKLAGSLPSSGKLWVNHFQCAKLMQDLINRSPFHLEGLHWELGWNGYLSTTISFF